MTLHEYLKKHRDLLSAFETYWAAANPVDPVNYPSDMASGDWDEQFLAYADLADQGFHLDTPRQSG